MTGRPKASRVYLTEGQRRLDTCGRTEAEIATVAGVTQPTVHRWAAGMKLPNEAAQARLEAGLAIPRVAWTQRPGAGTEGAITKPAPKGRKAKKTPAKSAKRGDRAPAPASPRALGRLAALEHQRTLASHANALVDELLEDDDSPARERAEAMKAASTANAALGRLEVLQRQTLEGIFDSTDWQRVHAAVQNALEAFSRRHGPQGRALVTDFVGALQAAGLPLEDG